MYTRDGQFSSNFDRHLRFSRLLQLNKKKKKRKRKDCCELIIMHVMLLLFKFDLIKIRITFYFTVTRQ